MRHEPLVVDAVAREAAAKVIVDAPSAHMLGRQKDRIAVRAMTGLVVCAPQQFQCHRLREFCPHAEAAIDNVDPIQ